MTEEFYIVDKDQNDAWESTGCHDYTPRNRPWAKAFTSDVSAKQYGSEKYRKNPGKLVLMEIHYGDGCYSVWSFNGNAWEEIFD